MRKVERLRDVPSIGFGGRRGLGRSLRLGHGTGGDVRQEPVVGPLGHSGDGRSEVTEEEGIRSGDSHYGYLS